MSDTYFLWGGSGTRPDVAAFSPRSHAWWTQYSRQINLGTSGLAELYRTCCGIVSLLPDPTSWGTSPRPFRGLVVGAVQSGKTSSMIGVSSVAVDQGFRLIVVLAGGKDDLRRQTARRFNTQLIVQRDEVAEMRGAYTIPMSKQASPLGGLALPYSVDIHAWSIGYVRVRETLRRNEPCLFVIKKHEVSLAAMRAILARAYEDFGYDSLPTLVLDDECDEASVERTRMPIPEAIANLWRFPRQPAVAYLGYTATAAANLLQDPSNELYPEHAVTLLRYPEATDGPLSYRESNTNGWYNGGDCFYEAFGDTPAKDSNFLVDASVTAEHLSGPFAENESLRQALRAYIVSGAYRMALQDGVSFSDVARLPLPHTMLVQTSASVEEHERWLRGIVNLFGPSNHTDRMCPDAVLRDVSENPETWEGWYRQFRDSRERLYLERPPPGVFGHATWANVRALLRDVVNNTIVKAVNSDTVNGSDLDYAIRIMKDGSVRPPQDIYVIAIGGARLSRGITLEGLGVSYFTRWNPSPTEDTVLQISRWFGFRGAYLSFCRLFTLREIYQNLLEMNENDRDLRLQLFHLMTEKKTPREAGLVLRSNPRSLPTAKIGVATVFDLAFSPYQNVFRDVEMGAHAEANQTVALGVVANVMARDPQFVVSGTGRTRGYVSREWSIDDVASVLDSLSYEEHNPRLEGNPAGAFHKSADPSRPCRLGFPFLSDPYQVAAYLRQWSELWRIRKCGAPPAFNVGYAFGEEAEDCEPFTFPLLNREISANGKLVGQWTGRSAAWRGDALFDDPDERLLRPGSTSRMSGLPGLLLLYVIHKAAKGRGERGVTRSFHTPTFGIAIPDGGPVLRRVSVKPS